MPLAEHGLFHLQKVSTEHLNRQPKLFVKSIGYSALVAFAVEVFGGNFHTRLDESARGITADRDQTKSVRQMRRVGRRTRSPARVWLPHLSAPRDKRSASAYAPSERFAQTPVWPNPAGLQPYLKTFCRSATALTRRQYSN